MSGFRLVPHPDFPSPAVTAINAAVTRHGATLSLSFTVEGDLEAVRWPEPAAHIRTDNLWMHTCFEAFVQPLGQAGYMELNMSPSCRWASYAFDGHRSGMHDAAAVPSLSWRRPALNASVALPEIGRADWRIGLSAVIETTDGSKSFWALSHADGPPDFHDAACFVATLAAPRAP